jgi:hypothetical protein
MQKEILGMSNEKYLNIYLNDHLAGSIVGYELAKRSSASNQGTSFGDFLETLVSELETDRASLEEVMDMVGAPKDRVKPALGWLAEKMGRLKLNGQIRGYSPLSRVLELEGLRAGVEAKLCLWISLKELSASDGRLVMDFDRLIERATSQQERLEEQRLEAARIAFEGF